MLSGLDIFQRYPSPAALIRGSKYLLHPHFLNSLIINSFPSPYWLGPNNPKIPLRSTPGRQQKTADSSSTLSSASRVELQWFYTRHELFLWPLDNSKKRHWLLTSSTENPLLLSRPRFSSKSDPTTFEECRWTSRILLAASVFWIALQDGV